VLALLPPKRQNLLFSATFSDDIRALADGLLDHPATVEVARRNTPTELVDQRAIAAEKGVKRALLAHLVNSRQWQQVLVFTRTKHGANRLAEQLTRDGISAMAIHGNKSQGARTRALSQFKDGSLRVLVATDIAARGLDIVELPVVVNYELPNVPEDYVHRIGRTGRAGCTGLAYSLVASDEQGFLSDIEKLIRRQVVREALADFDMAAAIAASTPGKGTSGCRCPARGHPGPGGCACRGARRPAGRVRRASASGCPATRGAACRGWSTTCRRWPPNRRCATPGAGQADGPRSGRRRSGPLSGRQPLCSTAAR
jgi:ATP-dependent RNA helicase RhlE